jgi:hypothetical protein
MKANNEDRLKKLLVEAIAPVEENAEPRRDLWPAVLRRLDETTTPPWFDWALLGGLTVMAVAFPAAIPVVLYYL